MKKIFIFCLLSITRLDAQRNLLQDWSFNFSVGYLFNTEKPGTNWRAPRDKNIFYPVVEYNTAYLYLKNYPGRFIEFGLSKKANNNRFNIHLFLGRYKALYQYELQWNNYLFYIHQTLIDRIVRYKVENVSRIFPDFYLSLGTYVGIYWFSFWEISQYEGGRAKIIEDKTIEWGLSAGVKYVFWKRSSTEWALRLSLNYDVSIITIEDIQFGPQITFKL